MFVSVIHATYPTRTQTHQALSLLIHLLTWFELFALLLQCLKVGFIVAPNSITNFSKSKLFKCVT